RRRHTRSKRDWSSDVCSSDLLGSAFAPAYVCAVWWKKANAPGAIASMIAGSVGAIAAQLLGLSDSVGLDPMLVGIVLSIIAIIEIGRASCRERAESRARWGRW